MDEEDLDENDEEKVKSKIQKTTFTLQQLTSLLKFRGDSTNEQNMTVNEWFKRFELLAQVYNWGLQAQLGALLSKRESATYCSKSVNIKAGSNE